MATAGGGSTGSSIATGGGAMETGGGAMETGRLIGAATETAGLTSDIVRLDVLSINGFVAD